ncbi:hypothetical protein WR25_02795 [Diploscapter pachys]|uniref:Cathepsin L-like n=1 Tax=Diploscapter pachys TaxID=2018661 RepID=A0A2A2LYK7_9BILA|nr:hypothetical protein WR25_02795 [Diploscapter pachys]
MREFILIVLLFLAFFVVLKVLRDGQNPLPVEPKKTRLYKSDGEWKSRPRTTTKKRIQAEEAISKWNEFKAQFSKFEIQCSAQIRDSFQTEATMIHHNEVYRMGGVSFEMGINRFADLPFQKLKKLNGFRRSFGDRTRKNGSTFLVPFNANIPESVDWRERGLVSEVKDQGDCGSCWAFSATGSLEGQHMRKTGLMVSLSEQNLVDCSRPYGNNGCDGGQMEFAFTYVKENHGIDTEGSYPYIGKEDVCHFKMENVGATDSGFVELPSGDEEKLKIAIATQGPISVGIDANHLTFALYKSGVFFEKNCSSTELDHGVLVVGYGTDPQHGDYWLVKNSWGTDWGDEGYIKMARNRNNHCGIATAASYPIV